MDKPARIHHHATSLLLLGLIVVSRSAAAAAAKAGDDSEYCIRESFTATCAKDEVIMMTSAKYGRMRAGRCVGAQYGIVGCHTDVLKYLEQKCSGRRECDFTVRSLIEVAQPCPKDLSNYLDATYSCIKVAKSNNMACLKDGRTEIGGNTGYIASTAVTNNGPGTLKCPWKIAVDPTQKIRLTLFDFDKPIEPGSNSGTRCSLYAVIEEEIHTKEESLCELGIKNKELHVSTTNAVSLYFIDNQRASGSRHFMIKYEAIGCPKLVPPGLAWASQDRTTATVKCNVTDETWYLTCKGNTWIGQYGNCTKGAPPLDPQQMHDLKTGFPYGILLAVIIGVILGAIIGSILLGFVYMCFKKQTRPNTARARYPHDPPEMTLALRMGDDGKSVYPSLVKPPPHHSPRPQHPGDYPGYGYGGRPYVQGIRTMEVGKPGRLVADNKQSPQPPFMSQSSDESDHIYESANFERPRPPFMGDGRGPTVYYELESEGFGFLDEGDPRK